MPPWTRQEEVAQLELGLIDDDMRGTLPGAGRRIGQLCRCLLDLARSALYLLQGAELTAPQAAEPWANLLAASGNCATTVCICPRSAYAPSANAPIAPIITISDAATRGILIRSSHATGGFSVYARRTPSNSEIRNACAHSSANTTAIAARIESATLRTSSGTRTTASTGPAGGGTAR